MTVIYFPFVVGLFILSCWSDTVLEDTPASLMHKVSLKNQTLNLFILIIVFVCGLESMPRRKLFICIPVIFPLVQWLSMERISASIGIL